VFTRHRTASIRLATAALHLLTIAGALVLLAPARPTMADASAAGRSEEVRGPDLIREYFRRWHDPYPADLDRATLTRIWDEIDALPEAWARGGGVDPWQPLGPFGIDVADGGRYTGRVTDLEVGPDGLRAVAAASGGVWVDDVGGWRSITDDLSTLWIGSLDIHPTDEDVMVVGTGEPFLRAGTGLWRTTDGGDTWANLPLSPPPATCFRIRFAPDGTTVHGAFDLGYYRSTDGGVTWTRRLDLGQWPTDLAIHPVNPDVLFLTVYGEGLFRSTDAGLTWSEVMGTGLPRSDIGRGALTISASDPDRMYVAYARPDGILLGTFRTDDGGSTWTDISPHEYMWGQGWYNNTIAVSPSDPDLVVAGGGELLRSIDGGATWQGVSDPELHVDYHASSFSADGAELWLGHDGGWSYSPDAGVSWSAVDNTIPITQFVSVGASLDADPVVVGGGSQDNGISFTRDGGTTWTQGLWGDGGGFAVDPGDPDVFMATVGIYGGSWPFRRHRSIHGGASWFQVNGGIGLASQWWIRIHHDRADPPVWYSYGDEYVYRSTSGGFWTGMNQTATAFPHHVSDVTAGTPVDGESGVYACLASTLTGERLRVWTGDGFEERSTGFPAGVSLRTVSPHPRDPDVAFALMNGIGTPGEKVFRTDDRGLTWVNVTGDLPDVPLGDLVAHPTVDGHWVVGTEMGAFQTFDAGASWTRWHLGLPEAAVMTEMDLVDRLDTTGEVLVVAATYGRGMWVRELGAAPVSVQGATPAAPPGPVVHAVAPNPFRDGTTLTFTLAEASPVVVRVVDVTGREVLRLAEGRRSAGLHRLPLTGARLGAGVYFVEVDASGGTAVRRVTRVE